MLNSQPRQVQNWIKTEAYNIHTICFYLFSFDCNLEKRGKNEALLKVLIPLIKGHLLKYCF